MANDKRNFPRQSFKKKVRIYNVDGTSRQDCEMIDVSHSGGRLLVSDPSLVPDEFLLSLTANGRVRRVSRVVWRADDEVGVRFRSLDEAVARVRAGARPR
jgi:hypothetical protein